MRAIRGEMREGQVAGTVVRREPVDVAGGRPGIAQRRAKGFEELGGKRLTLRGDKSYNVHHEDFQSLGRTMGKTAAIDKVKAVVIAGATASGKSALALDLAADVAGTVINADSMQIYRDLPILTAQPDAASMAAVPHRLYGILPLDDPATAARWAELAAEEIKATAAKGRVSFLVGGTGLYLRALLEGFAPIPEIDPAYRREAQALLAELGPDGLHARLQALDPETAGKLPPRDSQRLMRGWEVLAATGRPLVWWQRQPSN